MIFILELYVEIIKTPYTVYERVKIPNEPDVMKPDSTTVFSFPMKAPTGAVTRTEMTAIEQLDFWLAYQTLLV